MATPKTSKRLSRQQREKLAAEAQQREMIAQISELYYRRRLTQAQVADALAASMGIEISQQQVSYYIQKLNREAVERAQTAVDDARADVLERVRNVEREAMQAWEKSKIELQSSMTEQNDTSFPAIGDQPAGAKRQLKARVSKTQRDPNPDYLTVALRCNERESKLLGLDMASGADNLQPGVQVGIDLSIVLSNPAAQNFNTWIEQALVGLPQAQQTELLDRLAALTMDAEKLQQEILQASPRALNSGS